MKPELKSELRLGAVRLMPVLDKDRKRLLGIEVARDRTLRLAKIALILAILTVALQSKATTSG